MSLQEAKAKWRAKNEQMQKAIPVSIEGVGMVYVRPLTVADADFISGVKDDGGDFKGTLMAGLLCDESGERLPETERDEWADIFAHATWDDYLLMTASARGVTKESTEGN